MQEWIKIYVLTLGIVLVVMGAIDLAAPARIFGLWKVWVSKKLFFIHGILLICMGLPLTISKGALSGILLVVGLVPVLTGPFILIYPEKIKSMFSSMSEELNDSGITRMVRIEGALLIAAGTVCVASFLLT